GPAAKEHASGCRQDTDPAVRPGTDPIRGRQRGRSYGNAVPPLSGGPGEHGSEAAHAFTIAASVGGFGGQPAEGRGIGQLAESAGAACATSTGGGRLLWIDGQGEAGAGDFRLREPTGGCGVLEGRARLR